MFQPWRWKIRAAQTALRNGQLDEASRLLAEHGLGAYCPGQKLSADVARAMVQRAEAEADVGHSSAGWRDLKAAQQISGENPSIEHTRNLLLGQALAEIEILLEAGELGLARARLDRLERRHPATATLRMWRQIANRLDRAKDLCRKGKYADADAELTGAVALRPDLRWLKDRVECCRARVLDVRRLAVDLHQALAAELWPRVLEIAESLLELSPEDQLARRARTQAWAAVGMKTTRTNIGAANNEWDNRNRRANTRHDVADAHEDTVTRRTPHPRFIMWIDSVGGFLVCLGDEIVIGPPSNTMVDVPILADISRRHAVIRRDGEGYLIEPVRDAKLDGRALTGLAPLQDGNLIELGEGLELRFRKPHALSNSARLDFESRHRTQPHCDGILLMAETCVLGQASHSHVACRDWEHDLVLFRQGDELHCRGEAELIVDGVPVSGATPLTLNSQVVVGDQSVSLEELS